MEPNPDIIGNSREVVNSIILGECGVWSGEWGVRPRRYSLAETTGEFLHRAGDLSAPTKRSRERYTEVENVEFSESALVLAAQNSDKE